MPVILHCFSGTEKDLEYALSEDYFISVVTLVCKSTTRQALVPKIPIEKMLLETDAPWNDPMSRDLVNRPWKIEYSADTVASIQGLHIQDVLKQTEKNAREIMKI